MSKQPAKGKEKSKEIKVKELVSEVNRAYCYAYQPPIYPPGSLPTGPMYHYPYPYPQPSPFYHPAVYSPPPVLAKGKEATSYDKLVAKGKGLAIDGKKQDEVSKARTRIQQATKELKKKAASSPTKGHKKTVAPPKPDAAETKWKPVAPASPGKSSDTAGQSDTTAPEQAGIVFTFSDSSEDMDISPTKEGPTAKEKNIDFKLIDLEIDNKKTNFEDVVKELQLKAFNMSDFSMKSFARENSSTMFSIFQYFVQNASFSFELHDVCDKLLLSFPVSVPVGTFKRLFKRTYRRHQIEQLNPLYDELRAKIKLVVEELEPGEDTERIWSPKIEEVVVKLLKSKYKNICSMTLKNRYQRHWMDKFLMRITTDTSLWSENSITYEFLRDKTVKIFPTLYPDLWGTDNLSEPKKVRAVPVYVEKRHSAVSGEEKRHSAVSGEEKKHSAVSGDRSYHERGYRRSSSYNKSPRHSTRRDKSPTRTSSSSKSRYKTYDKYEADSHSRSSKSRRKSRYHSDESHHHHSPPRRSSRRKRYSDETLHSARSGKRIKYDTPAPTRTSFDEKLRSCELVIDPFKEQEDTPGHQVKNVFETKGNIKVSIRGRRREQIRCILDELEEALEKESGTATAAPSAQICDKEKKKSQVLRDAYPGDVEVVLEDLVNPGSKVRGDTADCGDKAQAEQCTVVLRIQGYLFEGTATSEDEALEDASYKALLLAPYLLKTAA